MASNLPVQTTTFNGTPTKEALTQAFVGKTLRELRTPAFIVDRAIFAENCAKMHVRSKLWDCQFRAHVKTHKTTEGTRLQLKTVADTTKSVVVSTVLEAWSLVHSGLVSDGTIDDILYGLPVALNKIGDLAALIDEMEPHGGVVRLMIDSPDQVRGLEGFNSRQNRSIRWSVFFKVDLGSTKRAGLVPSTPQFRALLEQILESSAVSLHGFYCHAGTSYDSTSLDEATSWLTDEVTAVLDAATQANELVKPNHSVSTPLILSVGSTPTAHAFSEKALTDLRARLESCGAKLELHAGNYPMLDLQQLATSLIDPDAIAQRVIASVIAYYPGRGDGGSDEAMCDAGGIAMSKDQGPIPGFGDVIDIIPAAPKTASPGASGVGNSTSKRGIRELGWRLGRMSQEHGILTRKKSAATGQHIPIPEDERLHLGDIVEIIGQHACMIAAAYPWYYIVDSSKEQTLGEEQRVVDIWVPYKGW